MDKKILIVDDDANLLSTYQRAFHKEFVIVTAEGGESGLTVLKEEGPFAVIISDFRMPGIDGIEFLAKARKVAPKSVRILLTGYADLNTAVEAVNQGSIFRLLIKPCPHEQLALIINDAIAQYSLLIAEKELFEKTLRGSIKMLTDVLSLVNPNAFSHASRVRRLVKNIAEMLEIGNTWQLEIAAMLSQVGCITIPDETLTKLFSGKTLSTIEQKMYQLYTKTGADLIVNIPRLEKVSNIIRNQETRFDDTAGDADGNETPIESRMLKAALDYDLLLMSGFDSGQAIVEMYKREGWYDPEVVNALEKIISAESKYEIKSVKIEDLEIGMILAEDIHTIDNTLIITKGGEVSMSLRVRLENFKRSKGIPDEVKIIMVKD